MKAIRANKYFDPNDCPFEVLGFFEQFMDMDRNKVLGSRVLEDTEAPRWLGAKGIQESVFVEPVVLRRGYKEVTVKASAARPLRVASMVQILCGRMRGR